MVEPMRLCWVCGKPCRGGKCPNPRHVRESWRDRRTRRSKAVYASEEYKLARQDAFVRSGGRCVYCAALATTGDHVIPIEQGGAAGAGNVVAACSPCNTSKGPRTPEEWVRSGTAPEGARRWIGRGARAKN